MEVRHLGRLMMEGAFDHQSEENRHFRYSTLISHIAEAIEAMRLTQMYGPAAFRN